MKASELHRETWQAMQRLRSRESAAVLLGGRGGILKTELAIEFSASLLCEGRQEDRMPCGVCPACNWFTQGSHPDYRHLRPDAVAAADEPERSPEKRRPSREIRIDQIREMGDFLTTSTHRSGRRVIVISPAEAMNRNTANALLKALEEPQPGTFFFLASDEPDLILPTIRSRCFRVAVPLPARAKSLEYLVDNGVSRPEHWLQRAGGAPGLARNLVDAEEGRLVSLLERYLAHPEVGDRSGLVTELEKLLRNDGGLEMISVVTWMQRLLADHALSSFGLPKRHFSGVLTEQGNGATAEKRYLFEINQKLTEFKKLSKHTLNNKLFLEEMLSFFQQDRPTESRQ